MEPAVDLEPAAKPQGVTPEAWRKLSLKQQRFVASYAQHGNAMQAYLDAGYLANRDGRPQVWLQRRGYAILQGKSVRAAILEYDAQRTRMLEAKKDFALDWIVMEHERLMKAAEEKGDLAVATRNLELIGRTRGAYAESVRIDVAARREFSEAERVEAARLARLLLTDGEEGAELEADGAMTSERRNVPIENAPELLETGDLRPDGPGADHAGYRRPDTAPDTQEYTGEATAGAQPASGERPIMGRVLRAEGDSGAETQANEASDDLPQPVVVGAQDGWTPANEGGVGRTPSPPNGART